MLTALIISGIFTALLLEAFFSGTETAITSANRINLKKKSEDGSPQAKLVLATLERPETFLSSTLVGTNLAVVSSTTLADTLIAAWVPAGWEMVANAMIMTPLILIAGEILPKSLGRMHADTWSMYAVKILVAVQIILKPLISSVGWLSGRLRDLVPGNAARAEITREDIQTLTEIATEEGMLDQETGRILQNLFSLHNKSLEQIMVPLDKVAMVPLSATVEDVEQLSAASGYTRFPVYDGRRGNIVGIIDLRAILYGRTVDGRQVEPAAADSVKPFIRRDAARVSLTRPLSVLLQELRRQPLPMAILYNPRQDNCTAGIVTAEDLTEELVGEILDERDKL